ncbi:MAG TPA: I78 family peptidase inhibitor [Croceibacterium sp.]
MKTYLLTTFAAGIAGAAALGGCATATLENNFCNADPGQLFVGQKADAEAGLAIRQATGADEVRWGPPRSPMTMDFRQGRVTVSYDDDMIITRVACG